MFGFLPAFVLRVIVRLYPKNDPRRRELIAELYILKRFERPMWVAEQIETGLFEGPSARRRERRARRSAYVPGCRSRIEPGSSYGLWRS
jgi:hypothetical protein